MYGIQGYEAFFVSAVVFAMTPGLDTAFLINKAISRGRRPAMLASLGINAGVMVHTLAAALGLSALLARTAMRQAFGTPAHEACGELYFEDPFGKQLPLGIYYRLVR